MSVRAYQSPQVSNPSTQLDALDALSSVVLLYQLYGCKINALGINRD